MNKQILVSALGAMLLASCADHFDQNFETVRPGKEAQYGYLEQYDALKEYIKDRPNFHLGIGTTVDEYNKKELVYALTNSNFNETVAGNAMKMASCVADDGSMDFDKVKEYVKNATDAGLSVYGHTLAWHSQQPNKYLNGLIKDKELPPAEDNPGLIITSGDPKANTWDYEIYYDLDEPLKAGKTYEISLNVRGTNPGTIDFWPGKKDGSATQYGAGSFTVAESAIDNSFSFTPNADIDRMRFCFGKVGGTLYFDNFVLKEKGSDHNIAVNSTFDEDDISHWTKVSWVDISYEIGNVAGGFIPLTPDEKKEKLTPVLQNWIYGMMEATEGKVKAWDVVNEAISGEDKDGDGYYDLQSATRGTVSADDAKNNFYWQDYLGDTEYVRTAVAAARKGFKDAGGNPEELKLFINDYNLETVDAQNNNKKLESLIHWIDEWQKDGVTKIDGIGSQMHVTCSMDPAKQKKNEEAYLNMLHKMVDSHMLVRISELDMGLADKDGNLVNTTDMTEEQHKAMRAYYEFIVKKYLEIVPKEQQWGICQWCATDSPANSGWRAGLPVGLWDLDYYRKHTYGGFAAGLGAPEYWNDAK
ncbi:endo-1,4-beta-xylanase [Segatella copri]|uniref:endo-1,4-beta-xylanase n=1 Tax=Segatella copri TaxID=165179 RepID=UPI002FEF0DF6